MTTPNNNNTSNPQPLYPDQETPQGPQTNNQNRIQNFDQSLNHSDIEQNIEKSLKLAQKEMHQKRIATLRNELDYIKTTDWKFEFDKGLVQ